MKRLASAAALILAATTALAQSVQPASVPQPLTPDAGSASWSYGPYSYDAAGNIIAIGAQSYEYDTLDRLVKGSAALTPGQQANQVHVYSYDVYGNLTSAGLQGSPTAFSVSPGTNRMNGLSYDVGGNVTSWQPAGSPYTRQYTYDEMNMLVQEKRDGSTDVTFHIYTADDERYWVYRDRNGTVVSHFTIRDLGGQVLRDFEFTGSSTWSVFRDYIYRNGTLLASIAPAGTRHVSVDHLGSPRLFTDDSRNIIGAHAFFPFGGEYSSGGQEGDVLKFTAHERDASFVTSEANSLDYMHARYYSSHLGRFLSTDRLDGHTSEPQSWNKYTYALNNPLRLVDRSGMYPCDIMTPKGILIVECVDGDLSDDTSQGDRELRQLLDDMMLEFEGKMAMMNERGANAHNNAIIDNVGYHNLVECFAAGDCISGDAWGRDMLSQMPFVGGVGGKINKLAKADDLIRGSLKRSPSYRSELGQKTIEQLEKMARDKSVPGYVRKAAQGMLKLVRDAERLLEKGNKK